MKKELHLLDEVAGKNYKKINWIVFYVVKKERLAFASLS
jgi:putative methionine-R-sulfoxide reductase with GAF domain